MEPFEKQDLVRQVLFFKALAHPTRLWIVRQLRERDYCVHEFVQAVGDDFSTISKHLTVLKDARIVADNKKGKTVYYRLSNPCIVSILQCMEETV